MLYLTLKVNAHLFSLGSRINTQTFRKKKNPNVEPTVVDSRPADDFMENSGQSKVVRTNTEQHSPRPTPERDVVARTNSQEHLSDSPRGSDYKLTDVVDVRVLARMQEDSKFSFMLAS